MLLSSSKPASVQMTQNTTTTNDTAPINGFR